MVIQFESYTELIKKFLKRGYKCQFFHQKIHSKQQLIIRHDIDVSIKSAYEMSLIEDELGVKSTYFLMLNNPLYNIFEKQNQTMLQAMLDNGHCVGLHFDATMYSDIESGIYKEKKALESSFDIKINILSFHRPSQFLLNNPASFLNLDHTYQPKFFSEIKYFSDGGGTFSYGHPVESTEFKDGQTIQLLLHPIWWVNSGLSVVQVLDQALDSAALNQKEYIANNCKPYKKRLLNA
jgi:hypothetical protein